MPTGRASPASTLRRRDHRHDCRPSPSRTMAAHAHCLGPPTACPRQSSGNHPPGRIVRPIAYSQPVDPVRDRRRHRRATGFPIPTGLAPRRQPLAVRPRRRRPRRRAPPWRPRIHHPRRHRRRSDRAKPDKPLADHANTRPRQLPRARSAARRGTRHRRPSALLHPPIASRHPSTPTTFFIRPRKSFQPPVEAEVVTMGRRWGAQFSFEVYSVSSPMICTSVSSSTPRASRAVCFTCSIKANTSAAAAPPSLTMKLP